MQHKLLLAIAIVAIVGGVWYGLSASSAATPILTTEGATEAASVSNDDQDIVGSLLTLRAVSLAGTIFTDPGYRALEDFSTPIQPEPVGRTNPLLPLPGAATASAAATHQAQLFAPKK